MNMRDYVRVLLITWFIATLPFVIIGYGYSRSAQELIYVLARAFVTIPTFSKFLFNVFLFSPWIILLALLLLRIWRVALDSRRP